MSAVAFAIGLGIIALVAILGLVWAEREPLEEPTGHGDREP